MTEKSYTTPFGKLYYWVSTASDAERDACPWLVFLPGLTADRRLFDRQIDYFKTTCNCMVWDAPAHGKSRPAALQFSLEDMAQYLHEIFALEQITAPVLIGQSMGGYLAQMYLRCYPDKAAGFIAVDSAPLQSTYYAAWELLFLKHTKMMYRSIPWQLLVAWSAAGNAETEYGRNLMRDMMQTYGKEEFCSLAAHGFRIIAEAIECCGAEEYVCPTLLLCGEKDNTGFVRRYNKAWAKKNGYPLEWIPKAGHNSNTDNPDAVNAQILYFLNFLIEQNK